MALFSECLLQGARGALLVAELAASLTAKPSLIGAPVLPVMPPLARLT
jgi:hypothetical protein